MSTLMVDDVDTPASSSRTTQEAEYWSFRILLAEHARLTALYQHNAAMGDRLMAAYLTIISAAGGLLLAIGRLSSSSGVVASVEIASGLNSTLTIAELGKGMTWDERIGEMVEMPCQERASSSFIRWEGRPRRPGGVAQKV